MKMIIKSETSSDGTVFTHHRILRVELDLASGLARAMLGSWPSLSEVLKPPRIRRYFTFTPSGGDLYNEAIDAVAIALSETVHDVAI